MLIKYRVYTLIGYDEFTDYNIALNHHILYGIKDIETIEYQLPEIVE